MSDKKPAGAIEIINSMSPEQLAALRDDAEKWRDWTSGEYRLVCKEKYAQFAEAYKAMHPKKGRAHTVTIPNKCSNCQGVTFNVWGTHYRGKTQVEVRCMRCGKPHGKP